MGGENIKRNEEKRQKDAIECCSSSVSFFSLGKVGVNLGAQAFIQQASLNTTSMLNSVLGTGNSEVNKKNVPIKMNLSGAKVLFK